MPEEDNKILKCSHSEKYLRAPFAIYADLECFLEKMSTCHNNPKKSSTTKINKHRGKNCIKNFCLDLREHVTKLINYEKNK